MTLRNQISATAGIPQKRSTAISRKPMIRHPHSCDSVSVGFRTAAELLARFHARENGCMLSGAAAFAAMWRAVPLLRPLGLAARNVHVLAFLEWVYRRFLSARPTLQRLVRGFGKRRRAV
jgi:hypothetical protein